jgi:hypothetical protein
MQVVNNDVQLTDYSSAGLVNVGKFILSNSDKTATANSLNEWSQARSSINIEGSIYIEVSMNPFANDSGILSAIGISKDTVYSASNPLADSATLRAMYSFYGPNTTYVFGVAFNNTTGAYAIYKNNELVKSGTVTPGTGWRIYIWGGKYYAGTTTIATANFGGSAFSYTPITV